MKKSIGTGIAVVVLLSIGIGATAIWINEYKQSERHIVTKVTDKERVCKSDGDGGTECEYLVFTEEGTFKVTDTWLYGRHNSSDAYGKIQKDKRYDLKVVGWRQGWSSSYPNILEAREVPG